MAISNNELGSSVRTKLNASLAKTDLISVTLAANLDTIQSTLSGKLGASETAADVNPAGTSIAAALSGKLSTSGTAADVNPAGTAIAAALSGKLSTSGTAADVNPAGTSIAGALSGKQASISFGTGVETALGVNLGEAGALARLSDIPEATPTPDLTGYLTKAALGTGVETALGNTPNTTGGVLTFSGSLGSPTALQLHLTGNVSAAAWTTSGIGLKETARTLTDTSSSGTVAEACTHKLGGNTIAASSATTFTHYYGTYFADPVAGTNVTLTNKWALLADSIRVTGTLCAAALRAAPSTTSVGINLNTTNHTYLFTTAGLQIGEAAAGQYVGFTSGYYAGTPDALLIRGGAAATIQLGLNHATAPTAQTLKAHNVTTGTGASLTLAGGTGSVASGAVVLNGGNRSAYIADPSAAQIRDILISHGLMASAA